MNDIWSYRLTAGRLEGVDLTGYKVEAVDGTIGKVDKHSHETDASWIVVDTGPWIFGREVLLPAGTITRIDTAQEKVYVNRTKQQVKDAPEFVRDTHLDDASYRQAVGGYWGDAPLGRY
ncbi:PRC-barrel domain containing protein [Streptomyces antimicrobicus]|uniref:PRC-barrel domain containing protein n=1 Tax=Streptomyces antimicrobicus TaxID=2883108 RepID=A0ABS8B6S2_9ACTN|nr:PRC-barrel domain containing protein [Streptomyces antimicrobicus]MCB5180321.1 PRC-barrel domain containing protein [Streptomyces antimicrobicus]